MKQKETIIEFMKGKEKVSLKDLYCIAGLKQASIRAIINKEVSKGLTFERLGKGNYKLKDTLPI
jgi:predicted transcriptional regulator of viral defense system